MSAPHVDEFGRLVVNSLRDEAIDFFDGLAVGRWRSPQTSSLQSEMASFTDAQRDIVRRCVIKSLDVGIHIFLFNLSELHDRFHKIDVTVEEQSVIDASDGLHGESFGDDGWIRRFGKHSEGRD